MNETTEPDEDEGDGRCECPGGPACSHEERCIEQRDSGNGYLCSECDLNARAEAASQGR